MPEKVLIVDDEHDIADLIEVYLQNENYTVYKFYSSKEALVCIESEDKGIIQINHCKLILFQTSCTHRLLPSQAPHRT